MTKTLVRRFNDACNRLTLLAARVRQDGSRHMSELHRRLRMTHTLVRRFNARVRQDCSRHKSDVDPDPRPRMTRLRHMSETPVQRACQTSRLFNTHARLFRTHVRLFRTHARLFNAHVRLFPLYSARVRIFQLDLA
eukprot:3889939-Rhodomonas_salina.1